MCVPELYPTSDSLCTARAGPRFSMPWTCRRKLGCYGRGQGAQIRGTDPLTSCLMKVQVSAWALTLPTRYLIPWRSHDCFSQPLTLLLVEL